MSKRNAPLKQIQGPVRQCLASPALFSWKMFYQRFQQYDRATLTLGFGLSSHFEQIELSFTKTNPVFFLEEIRNIQNEALFP